MQFPSLFCILKLEICPYAWISITLPMKILQIFRFCSNCAKNGLLLEILLCVNRHVLFHFCSFQVQVLFQDSLLQLAVCHLIMWRHRSRKCSLMLKESFLTLALWIVPWRPWNLAGHSNFTLAFLCTALGLHHTSWYDLSSRLLPPLFSVFVVVSSGLYVGEASPRLVE